MSIKKNIKKIIPPLFLESYHSLVSTKNNNVSWTGNYTSWQEAKQHSSGYESSVILETVKNALLKVKNGEAVYERDSVLFDKIQYSFPLLSALMWISSKTKELNVVDFGGSLGSSYFQNKFFIDSVNANVIWNVVEQEHFVNCGLHHFQSEKLKFYHTIDECFQSEKTNVLILSGVLQYLETPQKILNFISNFHFDYIIIDLTGILVNSNKSILTLQQIPESIYKASYPCWFFNEKEMMDVFADNYNLIYDFDCELGNDLSLNNQIKAKYKGYFYTKI